MVDEFLVGEGEKGRGYEVVFVHQFEGDLNAEPLPEGTMNGYNRVEYVVGTGEVRCEELLGDSVGSRQYSENSEGLLGDTWFDL